MEISLENLTSYAQSVKVYENGEASAYCVGERKFEEICVAWNGMRAGARQRPASGVRLNDETVHALNDGVWAEFVFDKELSADGMPFERLLVNVQPEWSGFNIVRYTAEYGYDGRCFYFDLANDMSGFYNVLIK